MGPSTSSLWASEGTPRPYDAASGLLDCPPWPGHKMNPYSVMSSASAQRTAPGNRFERRKERTRRDILAAAERVLADKGFHETKSADIAEMADVGVGTVYLHFATREALFGAVVEDTVSRLKAFIDAARAGAPTVV